MAIFDKMGVVWQLIIDQTLIHPFFMKIAMSDLEYSHERPFSIIPKANTYEFLTKKWFPPEIQIGRAHV